MSLIPLIDGSPVFGGLATAVTTDGERQSRIGGAFGFNGLENQVGAGPTRTTIVTGTVAAYGPLGLAAAEALIRGFHDGRAHTLTDGTGAVWEQVLVGPYRPEGRVRQDPAGNLYRAFSLEITHLQ